MTKVEKYQTFNAMLSSAFSQELKQFLSERKLNHDQEVELLSENITNLLQREQRFGAARECSRLFEEFETHIKSQLTAALNEENNHA